MERRIAKLILSIQDDNQKKDKSLYTGDSGVCLALYLLGKVYQIPQAETEADKLFDGIYHVVGNIALSLMATKGMREIQIQMIR